MKRAFNGNSSMEYVLPIALVVVLGGVFAFTVDFQGLFRGTIERTNHGVIEDQTLKVKPTGSVDTGLLNAAGRRELYRTRGETFTDGNEVCLQGNICFVVPEIPEGTVGEVDGGLGGDLTAKLASMLKTLADQLEAAGGEGALVNHIRDLANQGYTLAEFQKGFQRECRGTCDLDSDAIAQDKTDYAAAKRKFDTLKKDVKDLFKSHPASLALAPEAEAIIHYSADQISTIASGVEIKAKFADGESANDEMFANSAQLTRFNSNTICTVGQGGEPCRDTQ